MASTPLLDAVVLKRRRGWAAPYWSAEFAVKDTHVEAFKPTTVGQV